MQNQFMPSSEFNFSVQESPEGGYEARALGSSIFAHADCLDELTSDIRDAVSYHFDPPDKPAVLRPRHCSLWRTSSGDRWRLLSPLLSHCNDGIYYSIDNTK